MRALNPCNRLLVPHSQISRASRIGRSCRIAPYWIKAAPMRSAVARRQRPGSVLEGSPAHASPGSWPSSSVGSLSASMMRRLASSSCPIRHLA